MIVVRFVFQAKPGKAEEAVNRFKEGAEMMRRVAGANAKVRLLTDLSGPFDTVVQEVEMKSLAEWEEIRAKIFSDPEFQDAQEEGETPILSGRTEFYTLEAAF
jgi:hypothetical protein